MTHAAARAAFGTAIDFALKTVKKDPEKGISRILDLTGKFAGDVFSQQQLAAAKEYLTNPENKWTQYIYRVIDEIDPHVLKMTALNLGFEAFLNGTKTIRKNR